MRAPRLLVALALVATIAPGLTAQERRFNTGFEFRTLSISQDTSTGLPRSVRQLAVPIGVVVPFSPRFLVDVGTYFAQAQREDASGGTASISGLTDVQARAVYEIVPDVLVFTLSANLPTGHATLEGSELDVAGAIASDLISFPVSNFGTGFSLTSGLAYALPLGSWAVGFAGSYRISTEFQPIADTANTRYRPGGEARLRFGVDRLVGQGRLSAGFTYSTFATDEYGGSGAYRSGARFIPQLSLSLPLGNNGLSLYMWDLYRANGEYIARSAQASNTRAPKQNTLAIGAALSLRTGRSTLRPGVEFRKQWEGDSTLSDRGGTLVGLTLRYQMPLGTRFTVQPLVRFDIGSVQTAPGRSTSFTGFGAGLSLSTSW